MRLWNEISRISSTRCLIEFHFISSCCKCMHRILIINILSLPFFIIFCCYSITYFIWMHEITLRQPSAEYNVVFFGESEERNIFPQNSWICATPAPVSRFWFVHKFMPYVNVRVSETENRRKRFRAFEVCACERDGMIKWGWKRSAIKGPTTCCVHSE
jgi:hypothetical protein